jgi:two-component system chemotaxis response regulator CheB
VVVVGASLGGLEAVQSLLRGLPGEFGLPVALVQHRDPLSRTPLAKVLQQSSALTVVEAEDKDEIVAGRVSVAPGDYHLLVDDGRFALSTEAPVRYARPSIDVLFESAAETYGAGVVGVILTGSSADGARGLAAIQKAGGLIAVQDPATARSRVMPDAAIALTATDRILPVPQIVRLLVDAWAGNRAVPAR